MFRAHREWSLHHRPYGIHELAGCKPLYGVWSSDHSQHRVFFADPKHVTAYEMPHGKIIGRQFLPDKKGFYGEN